MDQIFNWIMGKKNVSQIKKGTPMQIQEAHQISNKQEQTRNFQWHIIVKTEKRERAESSKKKKATSHMQRKTNPNNS